MIPTNNDTDYGVNGHDERERRAILCEIDSYTSSIKQGWSSVALPRDVFDALKYIHDHVFEEDTNVSSVCEACELRNHNISSMFKKHIGVGMQKYIELHRIELAKLLLKYDSVSIIDITWSVGYGNPETFSRAFRRNLGCAPTDYRTFIADGSTDCPLASDASNGMNHLD